MLPIMDVSRWQNRIDWDKVKTSGLVSGVMLKAVSTNRKLSKHKDGLYIDPTFERNYRNARAAGHPRGCVLLHLRHNAHDGRRRAGLAQDRTDRKGL